jgi:PAS domain S-box-containing protein
MGSRRPLIEHVDPPRGADAPPSAAVPILPAILDSVADGVTVQDGSGRLVYANEAALRLIGFASLGELLETPPQEVLARFELLDEAGAPMSPASLPGRAALEGRDVGPVVIGYRVRATGDVHWSQVRATPLIDEDGRITHAINTFHDITDRMRVEADLRASESSYRQLVEAMPQIAWTTDAAGRLLMMNDRWREYRGTPEGSLNGPDADSAIHPADFGELQRRWEASLKSGQPLEMTARIHRHDGAWRWHLVRAVPVRRSDGAISGWIGTSTDIDDERRSRAASALLAAAAERLDETLDPNETAASAAAIAVPELGDWCMVELLQPDGTLRRAGVAAVGWTRDDVERARGFVPDPAGDAPGPRAIREGRSVVMEIDDDAIEGIATSPGHAAFLRSTTAHSALAVPLIARGRTLGAMVFAWSRPDRRYGEAEVSLAEDVARHVGLALSNAALYAGEQAAREIAEATAARMETLQRMTRTLAQASSIEEAARAVTRDGAPALGAAAAVLCVPREDGRLEIVASYGYPEDRLAAVRIIDPDDPLPIAAAYAERRPIWVRDIEAALGDDPRVAEIRQERRNASLAAIPLVVGERAVGALGLSFATETAFDDADRELTLAQANVVAQAIDRLSLAAARERLLEDLEAQRNRLETVLRQMPAGVLIADAAGGLVLSNAQAGEIWRHPIPPGRDVLEYVEYVGRRGDGARLGPTDWPLVRALTSGETVTGEPIEIERFDGSRGWIAVDAAPVRDRDGDIVAAVSTFTDITAQRFDAQRQAFLAEASAVLASSLDYEETLSTVMRLAVPAIADWAVVDLVEANGELGRLVVAHVDPSRVELARQVRERFPPDPNAPTGAAAVARTGKPELVREIPPELAESIPHPELRQLIEDLDLRSYMAVPLIAGGQTLGVVTFVGAESGRRFDEDDLRLAENLAERAAAAIQNARLFRDAARYKAVLDATLDAVFMLDPQAQRILYANRGAVDQLGWTHDELLGMAPRDVITELDEARLAALVGPLVAGELGSRTVTVTLRHRDGRRVPVEVLLQYVELPGEAGRVVAIARDITDRVEAQARLQRLAEAEHARAAELNAVIRAMGEGVVVCDAHGRVTLANPAAEELFPAIGSQTYGAVLAALEDAEGRAPRLAERGGPVELRVAGEPERWVELSTYPVSARADDPMDPIRGPETIVLIRDVTAARQRQAVRDTFIGVLSHELRTPVTTIYAGSKVLARGGLDEEIRRSVFEDIHVEAERLHRLVEDVIALQRFGETDATEIGKEPVLLQRILPAVVRSEEARWPGVTFELAVPGGIPTVVADPTYVEQVVRNLLSNAAKYGGPGSRVLAVVESSADEVCVRILDDGPGFPVAESDRLFELFFRSPSTAAQASGAGIGLFVCARLIRAMGGRIWAKPRPEGGAEFGFSLGTMTDE